VFLNYLENYKEYKFKVSSNSILHGDFHVNNLIYRSGKIYIIDWIYGEKGDCCKDFVRNIVNAYVSPIYARGQIDGYFNGNPCDEFWEKLLVFTILHQLELIDMIGRFNFITNDFINTQHNNVIYQYNNLKSNIPLYYKEG
jgi:serine/threonine-protein kinase